MKFKLTGLKFVLYKNGKIGFNSVLHIFFFFFQLYLTISNTKYSKKKYGLHFDKDILHLYFGLKEKSIKFPWQFKLYQVYVLKRDKTWELETKDNVKHKFGSDWRGYLYKERHPFRYYNSSGYSQNTKCDVTIIKKVYRRLKLNFLTKSEQYMIVKFDKGIGEKNDTIGTSYLISEDETIKNALRRMQNKVKL